MSKKISTWLELEWTEVEVVKAAGEKSWTETTAANGKDAAQFNSGEAAGGAEPWVSQQD